MRPTLLLFNLSKEKHAPLMATAARLKILVKHIPPEDAGQTLGVLLGMSPRAEDAEAAHLDDEMLVMANFSRAMMDQFLGGLKTLRVKPIRLKAILTPTNVNWTPAALFAELSEEAAAMEEGRMFHEEGQ